jgi:hypothetical protein
MPWQELSDIKKENLTDLPLILAGPILRRTEPASVTVWLALRESRTVTLKIYDSDNRLMFSGQRNTISLGTYLHIVAVTAITNNTNKKLQRGKIYQYDLTFGIGEELRSVNVFSSSGQIASITYGPYALPTFVLPPEALNKTRILHGSCRKPHGPGYDGLEALDSMLTTTSDDADKRPHQLFLTGDQIYADDVADLLLKILSKTGDLLLSWNETLPGIDTQTNKFLQPGKRKAIVREREKDYGCGFTSNACESHLLSFAEFCSMYLFTWSPVLWPTDLPDFKEVYEGESPSLIDIGPLKVPSSLYERYSKQKTHIVKFLGLSLIKIRRVLANIPTYMIFDDHEITDDWYLNREWVKTATGKALGKHVIQNGLLAYAIFQAWGNTPEQFLSGTKGDKLLQAAEQWKGVNSAARSIIAKHLGIGVDHLPFKDEDKKELFHGQDVLDWHYTIKEQNYQVIVLDTRTWRSYLNNDNDQSGLISERGLYEQFKDNFWIGINYPTIVISPAPVIGFPIHEEVQGIKDPFFDPEPWVKEKPRMSFELLLTKLATLPNNTSSDKQTRIIILSGDVHYGFAARLEYWGKRPFKDPTTGPCNLVIAQLTSSAFKNQDGKTQFFHAFGYVFLHPRLLGPYKWAGWNNPPSRADVYVNLKTSSSDPYDSGAYMSLWEPSFLRKAPALLLLSGTTFVPPPYDVHLPSGSYVNVDPDWIYRIDYIKAENEARFPSPFAPANVPAPPQGNRRLALQSYLAMASNYQAYAKEWGPGKEIVGLNNIGEISFLLAPDGGLKVVQELWWRLESSDLSRNLDPFPLTKYVIPLNFSEPMTYPEPIIP